MSTEKLPLGRAANNNGDAAPNGPAAKARPPLTVSGLVARIKIALASSFPDRVVVVGELSGVKPHSSGHLYFRLKDAGASIDAVMWRSGAERLKFRPCDGLEVVAEGRVDVYDSRGQLQLYVEKLSPRGAGALELAFRQLQEKLQREGLFDPAHKVPLPRYPRAVGIVTSSTGAAIRDIARTLARRWPAAQVYLAPALVQGEGAAADVARAIRMLDASAERFGIDTILVARGGGSLEDLWAFNEEAVARAIFAAKTPIVTGVGHETDVTIADLVADVRAPTPTAAAELAVPDAEEVARHVGVLASRLRRHVLAEVQTAKNALAAVMRSGVFRDPLSRPRMKMQRLDELSHRCRSAVREQASAARRRLFPLSSRLAALHPARLAERARARLDKAVARLAWVLGGRSKRSGDALAVRAAKLEALHPRNRLNLCLQKLDGLSRHLEAMSYRSVLGRGFSVTRGRDGQILRSATQTGVGSTLDTELVDGRIESEVTQVRPADGCAMPASKDSSTAAKRPRGKRAVEDDSPSLFD
jgi:exodeoxyribonuclease VII large subunit